MRGRHALHATSYHNSLSLLWYLTKPPNHQHHQQQRSTGTKRITFAEKNSIAMALLNYVGNHDWRIIRLREQLDQKLGWNIELIEPESMNQLKKLASQHLMTPTEPIRPLQPTEPPRPLQPTRPTTPNLPIMSLSEPNFNDHYLRNHNAKIVRRMTRGEREGNQTTVTRLLSNQVSVWTTLRPTWLTGANMLMLTGMCSDEQGRLMRGLMLLEERPEDCLRVGGPDCRMDTESPTIHTLWHRMTNCLRYMHHRAEIEDILGDIEVEGNGIDDNDDNDDDDNLTNFQRTQARITKGLSDVRKAQTILRAVTNLAFNKINDQ